jgi:carboxyl-terminal processing protease
MSSDATTERRAVFYTVLALLTVFFLAFAGGVLTHRLQERRRLQVLARPMGVFWEAWGILDEGFYGALPTARERTYGAIRGVLSLLDDQYTVFLEPQSSEIERNRLAGVYGGIGVDLWHNADGQVVLSPYADSPAQTAGVLEGDILSAIDGRSVTTDTVDGIRVRLRGEVDTTVILTLSRPPTPSFELQVVRAEIQVPSVSYRVLDADPSVGYLHITNFTERTPTEASEALDALLAAGVSRLILDLRDNGGGLIHSAVEVADAFLDGGVVLFETRRGGQETMLQAEPGGAATDLPLVVLVNNSTASASEMIAGALQVRERATLIGEQTYGKNSSQLIYVLTDGSSLHVTSAVWLLPNRRSIGPEGLSPDLQAAQPEDEPRDEQLDRAVRYLAED